MQKLNLDVKKIVLVPEYNEEYDVVLFYHNDPFLGSEDTVIGVGVPVNKGAAWLNKLGLKPDEVMGGDQLSTKQLNACPSP